MTKENIEWYLDAMKHELLKVNDIGFWGSVDFKINIGSGNINNMTVQLTKSVKRTEIGG